MCGILATNRSIIDLPTIIEYLKYRGPDATNHVQVNGVEFVHTLLSMTGPPTLQPFVSDDESVVAIFNGEIYNHMDLRKKVSDKFDNWKSLSDTETLVNCFDILGIEKTLELAEGMFAICVYDLLKNKKFKC